MLTTFGRCIADTGKQRHQYHDMQFKMTCSVMNYEHLKRWKKTKKRNTVLARETVLCVIINYVT